MKLVAIINAWADTADLLPICIESASEWADSIMVIGSDRSNTGEYIEYAIPGSPAIISFFDPDPHKTPQQNEVAKRNQALSIVRYKDFTHFIMMDADEFYKWEDMAICRHILRSECVTGFVHPLKVYVGKPTLWCEDHTLVPGIQRLYEDSELGNFKKYPFAYDAQGNAHIDPTRRTNQTTGIEMSPFYMHHMSYVRRDIDLKIRNSSANLRRSEAAIKRDIANAAPGYMSELYHRELKECENLFNITI
jgi:RNA polymerase subunit RPABC4/transcription elongation factor Spt4